MTSEEIYEIWRPKDSPWSAWVKPVVFAFLWPGEHPSSELAVADWGAPLLSNCAIIADLPGGEGVSAGIALARAGYRPVPVYNACPNGGSEAGMLQPFNAPVTVDMSAILTAICAHTRKLASFALPIEAPPVFLLDANRNGLGIPRDPGWFDNRSFVSSSDFPSADYFRRSRISKVILIQPSAQIQPDLRQVLLELQRGMTIARQVPWQPWSPCPMVVKTPTFFHSGWEWLRRKFAYRRDAFHGAFGGKVPPSAG